MSDLVLGLGTFGDVYPKTDSGRLATWVGVGGSPQSVIRTARHGLPLMLADHRRPARAVRPATSTSTAAPPSSSARPLIPIGMHSPGFIADTDEEAMRALLAALPDHARPDRRAARLAADAARGVRPRGRERLPLHRLAGDGRPQDGPGDRALASGGSTYLHDRRAAGQRPHARRRALRLEGHPHGPRHPRGETT